MRRIRDVMTPEPLLVSETASIQEAGQLMRDHGVGALLVVDSAGHVAGMITDRDIVVRACAEGRGPERTPVTSTCSDETIAMLSPEDDVREAAVVMREKAIRRIPVIENGRPIGIVTLGDVAAAEDPDSALGEISRAQPNS